MTISMFFAGFIIAFIKGWLMTLVMLASVPVLMLGGGLWMYVLSNKDQVLKKEYAAAGGRAEEAISAIKTVKMLNGETH